MWWLVIMWLAWSGEEKDVEEDKVEVEDKVEGEAM